MDFSLLRTLLACASSTHLPAKLNCTVVGSLGDLIAQLLNRGISRHIIIGELSEVCIVGNIEYGGCSFEASLRYSIQTDLINCFGQSAGLHAAIIAVSNYLIVDHLPHTFTFRSAKKAEQVVNAISDAGGIAISGIADCDEDDDE